ncbi:Ubiquitin carboxyl-terminal hydrolase family protein [Trichomonas vaginalis G3]|uniref:Ubiquitin carboxyl-terminal hydrolase family protein n=1 Tax=Trichomonas vaginalis (strain ATCC PRA-98 / G3) TaxID=412133 RepID=A2DWM7_TRIV3|nr:ubiquitinyl hydrolase protein [Trichomonas vaginalis G3]EAY15212.1 Ubiquitin carboxyl-terminal hydrolase family protein [Trichomonas vaginalis G3]KAI5550634.1 ubiquitinyl hydrolase protein [Trichomonas vaginalis G3]|eukprot:XP_001327435.1 Ubiquitin carboxyl-terminal hydrolase family protein [Trichomonas vaginalis G3]
MNAPKLEVTELDKFSQCIMKLVLIYSRAYCHGFPHFGKLLLILYDYDSSFYNKNGNMKYFSSSDTAKQVFTPIVSFFYEEPIKLFESYLIQNPSFESFDFIFKLIKAFHQFNDPNLTTKFINNITPSLLSLFASLKDKNIREIDTQVLRDLFIAATNTIGSRIEILSAAEVCLTSGIVEKQIIGAQNISKVASMPDNKLFYEWSDHFPLKDYLMDQEMHQTLFTTLIPAFNAYFKEHPMGDDQIWTLFNKARTFHPALKEPYLDFIAKWLSDAKLAHSFLDYVKSNTCDKEISMFLIAVLNSWPDNDLKIPHSIIEFFFSNNEPLQVFINNLEETRKSKHSDFIADLIINWINSQNSNVSIFKPILKKQIFEKKMSEILKAVFDSISSGSDNCYELFKEIDITGNESIVYSLVNNVLGIILKENFWKVLDPISTISALSNKKELAQEWIETLSNLSMENATLDALKFCYRLSHVTMTVQNKTSFDMKSVKPMLKMIEESNEEVANEAIKDICYELLRPPESHFEEIYDYILEDITDRKLLLLDSLIKYNSIASYQPMFRKHGRIRQNTRTFIVDKTKIDVEDTDNCEFIISKYAKIHKKVIMMYHGSERVESLDPCSAYPDGTEFTVMKAKDIQMKPQKDSINYLISKGICEILLSVLEDNPIAYSILLRLPTMEFLSEENPSENQENLTENLSDLTENVTVLTQNLMNSSGYYLRYFLHAAVDHPSKANSKAIIDAINEERITGFGIIEAALALSKMDYFEHETNKSLLMHLLKALNDFKDKDEMIIDVITKAIKAFPDTANSEMFRTLNQNRPDIVYSLVPALKEIQDKDEFANYLTENAKNENDIRLLIAIVDKSCDYKKLFRLVEKFAESIPLSLDLLNSAITLNENIPKEDLENIVNILLNLIPERKATNILLEIIKKQNDFMSQVTAKIKTMVDIKVDQWNYSITEMTKSTKIGLKNLGATCYMNSVLQVLFANEEFRNLIQQENDEDKKWLKALKEIFLRMEYTKLPFVDTSEFLSNWCFYGSEPTNPREQQDANEFLMLLLDRLPLAGKLYQGVTVTYMDAENQRVNEKEDNFYFIPLEVNKIHTMNDGFKVFLEHEFCTGYFVQKLNRKVDIDRYSRIRKCPKYLAIQLKRFDYNLNTFQRIKVEGNFIVPDSLDIAEISDNNQSLKYDLQGVVVHKGNAQSGHYTAMTLNGNDIFEYNDTFVSKISRKEYETNCYGSQSKSMSLYDFEDHKPSAYLLFYKLHETDEKIEINPVPTELITKIQKENEDFEKKQNGFSPNIMKLVSFLNDKELNEIYFFNVFCHSKPDSFETEAKTQFIDNLSFDVDKRRDDLIKIIGECSNEFIIDSTKKICSKFMTKEFALFLLEKIESVYKNWRCLEVIISLITKISETDIDWFISNEIPQKLIMVLIKIVEESTNSVFLQNANFSDILKFINEHNECITKEIIDVIFKNGFKLLQSTRNDTLFIEIVKKGETKNLCKFEEFISEIISKSNNSRSSSFELLFCSLVLSCESSEEFEKYANIFIDSPKVVNESIVESLTQLIQEKSDTKKKIVNFGYNILYKLATSDDNEIRGKTEQFFVKLFKSVSALDINYSESLLTSESEVKLLWNDKGSNKNLADDEKEFMLFLLEKYFEKLKSGFRDLLTGRNANCRLLTILRVSLLMVLRSQFIPQGFFDLLIEMILTIYEMKVKSDVNTLEIIRCFFVCNFETGQKYSGKFLEIVNAMFSLEANDLIKQARLTMILFYLSNLMTKENLLEFTKLPYIQEAFSTAFSVGFQSLSALTFLAVKNNDFKEIISTEIFRKYEKVSERGSRFTKLSEAIDANDVSTSMRNYTMDLMKQIDQGDPSQLILKMSDFNEHVIKRTLPKQKAEFELSSDDEGIDELLYGKNDTFSENTKFSAKPSFRKMAEKLLHKDKEIKKVTVSEKVVDDLPIQKVTNIDLGKVTHISTQKVTENLTNENKEKESLEKFLGLDYEMVYQVLQVFNKYKETIKTVYIPEFSQMIVNLCECSEINKQILGNLRELCSQTTSKEQMRVLIPLAFISCFSLTMEDRQEIGGMIMENSLETASELTCSEHVDIGKAVVKIVETDGYENHCGWGPTFLSAVIPHSFYWEGQHHLISLVLSQTDVNDLTIVILSALDNVESDSKKVQIVKMMVRYIPSRKDEIISCAKSIYEDLDFNSIENSEQKIVVID